MNARKFLLFSIYTIIVLVASVFANDDYAMDKRPQERPFMLSSRYGRSDNSDNAGKHVVVTPRLDKFFLGSRYGKRDNLSPHSLAIKPINSFVVCGDDEDITCIYSGLYNFYRCSITRKYEGIDDYCFNQSKY